VNQDPDFRIYFKSYVVYGGKPLEKLDPAKQSSLK
jgi:hypothetical protein